MKINQLIITVTRPFQIVILVLIKMSTNNKKKNLRHSLFSHYRLYPTNQMVPSHRLYCSLDTQLVQMCGNCCETMHSERKYNITALISEITQLSSNKTFVFSITSCVWTYYINMTHIQQLFTVLKCKCT